MSAAAIALGGVGALVLCPCRSRRLARRVQRWLTETVMAAAPTAPTFAPAVDLPDG